MTKPTMLKMLKSQRRGQRYIKQVLHPRPQFAAKDAAPIKSEQDLIEEQRLLFGLTPYEMDQLVQDARSWDYGNITKNLEGRLRDYKINVLMETGVPRLSPQAFQEMRLRWGYTATQMSALLGFQHTQNARSYIHNMEQERRPISASVSLLMRYMISYGLPINAPEPDNEPDNTPQLTNK